MTAISVVAAFSEDLQELNERILQNPDDVDLNLLYARTAEELGKLRLALAAYERVLINHPDNEEARRGFTRVRRVLEPAFDSLRVEVGGQWDSNPLSVDGSDEDAFTAFGRATYVNERRLGAHRWRFNLNVESEVTPEIEELNYGYLGGQVGPIVDLAPHLSLIPIIGFAVSTFGDEFYYDEVNAGAIFEGQTSGVSYWGRARAGWRDYGEDATAEEGPYAELVGGIAAPRVGSNKGSLALVPWVRWSDIEGSAVNFLNEEIAPGQYAEYGAEVTYHYQLNDKVTLSAGLYGHDRYYSETMVAGEERHDTYFAPEAAITLRNTLPCSCAIRMSYQHRYNASNDDMFDYDADRVSVSLIATF